MGKGHCSSADSQLWITNIAISMIVSSGDNVLACEVLVTKVTVQ